ncbi:MAG: ribosomal protein S18-alanine N-acetyltransferase [Ruminococcus sp.]|nr:ribosomal protein S18-alanine N-acetyltransferase [Ruminococcus sp.]
MTDIIPMNNNNYTDAALIERKCFFDRPWTAEQFSEELDIDFSRTFIAYEAGGAAGFVNIWLTPPSATINNIAVLPEMRGRGIADRLMDKAAEVCVSEGIEELTLEVRVTNAPAIALYEKHGLKNVGRRRDFYENPREDAFIMTRQLRGDVN